LPNLLLLDGCTFFLSQETGDVRSREPEGFFYADVRHLSQWRLLIDGDPLKVLTSRAVDYFSGRVVAAPKGKDPALTVERNRFVTDGGPYPDARAPEAWAAAAPLLALRTMLGLDVVDRRLRTDPKVPKGLGPIRLHGVRARGRRARIQSLSDSV
jgi:hypothetical protein